MITRGFYGGVRHQQIHRLRESERCVRHVCHVMCTLGFTFYVQSP